MSLFQRWSDFGDLQFFYDGVKEVNLFVEVWVNFSFLMVSFPNFTEPLLALFKWVEAGSALGRAILAKVSALFGTV